MDRKWAKKAGRENGLMDVVYDDDDVDMDVYGFDDVMAAGAGMRVWKYRFNGTKNFSVSCWKCVRRASFASTSNRSRLTRNTVNRGGTWTHCLDRQKLPPPLVV